MRKYKVVDLFAGAGGLSLGFLQTKKFDIKVAVEKDKNAQITYRFNHDGAEVLGDVGSIDFCQIRGKYDGIDVVIGGPPCQGFSNANRQKTYAISLNNRLVKEYVRAVEELQPKIFIMENVETLKSKVHRFFLEEEEESTLNGLNISYTDDVINLLPEDIKLESAEKIAQDDELINLYMWDEKIYFVINRIYKVLKNKSKLDRTLIIYKKQIEDLCRKFKAYYTSTDIIEKYYAKTAKQLKKYMKYGIITDRLFNCIRFVTMIQRMLQRIKELKSNKIRIYGYEHNGGLAAKVKSYSVLDYIITMLGRPGNDYAIKNDVLNAVEYGAPQKRCRFFILGVKKEFSNSEFFRFPQGKFKPKVYRTVMDAIGDIENCTTFYDVNAKPLKLDKIVLPHGSLVEYLRDSQELKNNIIPETQEEALKRFKHLKQGQNFHDLSIEMKENTYSDVTRTQNTIYLRLTYDEPCGTVLNVRKSMWIHPVLDRSLSIREAARLQTFPDSFVFFGTKDSQYQQIGNAVPPILAKALAKQVLLILRLYN